MSTRFPKIEAHIVFTFDDKMRFQEVQVKQGLFGSMQPVLPTTAIDEAMRQIRLKLDRYTRLPTVTPPDGGPKGGGVMPLPKKQACAA
ncbi:hypothetical protein [Methylocystis hirsuta]|uniref:Uncharacterized protein n=1 Tax=Methylocystis hirsuta TaxID=369798 RepID=A0A3M9XQN6_9HYPH|nr:hypothetical protein [Methylocystis hirsuta]RNJ49418.1 hypothetical protein D1O30_07170 [Methylocystis hirsuta]